MSHLSVGNWNDTEETENYPDKKSFSGKQEATQMNNLRVGNKKLPRECSYSRIQEAMQLNNLTEGNQKLPK